MTDNEVTKEERILNMRMNLLLKAADYVHATIPSNTVPVKREQTLLTFDEWVGRVFEDEGVTGDAV